MKYYTSQEYLEADFGSRLCIVDPIFPVGGLVLIHAAPSAGKSAFALTVARSVLEGSPLLGIWDEVLQDSVGLVQADMSDLMHQDRISRFGAYPDFHIFSTDRDTYNVIEDVDREADWVKKMQDLDLGMVIIDTLRRCHPYDENTSDVPVAVYTALRHAAGPRATIFALHHDNQMGQAGSQHASRGNTGWTGEIDTSVQLTTRHRKLHKLIFTKTRGAEEPEPVRVGLDPETLEVIPVADEKPVVSWLKRELAKDDARIRKAEIRAAATDMRRWGSSGGAMSDATFYRHWSAAFGPKA